MDDLTEDELLAELGINVDAEKKSTHTPREERIIAGFEDIVRFYDTHGRAPEHGENRDIFERMYAVRLDRLRDLAEAKPLLQALDKHDLLQKKASSQEHPVEALDDDALIEALGITVEDDKSISVLRHVVSREERNAAEEIANRERCKDFERFKPLFELADHELKTGLRQARRFARDASVAKGDFFILAGQFVYVADEGDPFRAPNGATDARLRVVYANGTESNLLKRSLQRALYKDETGRRLTDPSPGPLFADQWEETDLQSGTIYVLRSKSDHPFVAQHRELIHKIGVTGGSVETRVSGAVNDATYLLAEVEIVATYKLVDINRVKLEGLFHKIFASAQLDLTIQDRFGKPVRPREWFMVPLHVIDDAVAKVRDGTVTEFRYDATSARLVALKESAKS